MEDDRGSTATMTSVTEDLSLDETDTSTQDIDTSSQITSSDIGDEGNTTVLNTPLSCVQGRQVAADVVEVSMEGGSEADETMASTDEDKPDTSVTGEANHSTQQTSSASQPWGSGVLMPDLLTLQGMWYKHECFNHYWRHYHYVTMWCQKHMETYRRMMEQYNRGMKRQTAAGLSVPSQPAQHTLKKTVSKKTIRNRKARRRRKAAKKRHRMEKKNVKTEQLEVSSSPSHSSDGERVGEIGAGETTESAMEGEVMEAEEEITEELLDFFAHTHKHRQERDALKKCGKNGKEKEHVNIEDREEKEKTVTAPAERPGSRRTSEMRLLYGKGAAMIHGMETALQMTFDRNTDVLQPSMWPNMPLRIIF